MIRPIKELIKNKIDILLAVIMLVVLFILVKLKTSWRDEELYHTGCKGIILDEATEDEMLRKELL